MKIPHIQNDPSKVQLSRPSHVYFEHSDLKKFETFAKDFGLIEAKRIGDTIYYRGYGEAPYVYVASKSKDGKSRFGGPCFEAKTKEDFDKAAKLPGAVVKSLDDLPGGGEMITISRPGDTFMHIVYGQVKRTIDAEHIPSATHESLGPFNSPFDKPRKGKFQRFRDGPALVYKLGHLGYVCVDFASEIEFYTGNFNFVPTDILYHPDFEHIDVITFLHLDLDNEYSDHHSLFIQRAPPEVRKTYLHHTSFEVADFDTQLMGHQWLAKNKWKSVWGVGRHILGSQIFDYWYDSSMFKIEHYADGDVVNKDIPTKRDVAGAFSVWGPELPKDFGADGTAISLAS